MRKLKYPSTSMVRDKFGSHSEVYLRVKALEKWALDHGYDGYKRIQRRTKKDRQQQTELGV